MNLYEITRRQVENVKGMLEDPTFPPEDKKLLRGVTVTTLERAEQRGEITRQQCKKLKNLMRVIDPVILEQNRPL